MKKITIDARMLQASGIGTVTRNILKRLILKRQDWVFNVILNKGKLPAYSWLQKGNVRRIYVEIPVYSIREQVEILRFIPTDTDLFWVPHYNIPVFYRGKMVVTVHDLFHVAMPQFVRGFHKRAYAKLMFNAVVRKADKIICVSDFTRRELICFTGVKSSKIRVIYNGVDSFWYFPLQETQRLHNKPYILCVGNVKPHKNIRRLVLAFEKVANKIPQDLVIVGKKEGFITGDAEVVRIAEKASDRIFFTGFVSDEDLKNYYHYADLLVFPSLYEGFGLPPLEAMASGCRRILCSDIPVLKEIYGNAVDYFNPCNCDIMASKILKSLQEVSRKDSMLTPKYDWDFCAEKYEIVFEQILDKL